MRFERWGWGAMMAAAALGCQASSRESRALIDGTTVLAIQAEPPEAPPGSAVTFRALVVTGAGEIASAPLEWALCMHPRDVAENNSVAPECFGADGEQVVFVDQASSSQPVHTKVPDDACAIFGSEPLPADPGDPPTRPADPDATGGYYMPIRASVLEETSTVAAGQVRVRCALPAAPVDIARDYAARYRNNENPVLDSLSAIDFEGNERLMYRPGETLEMEASWGPEAAEPFVVYDAPNQRLVEVEETLRVSWFITGGSVAVDRTVADEGVTQVRVTWTAPTERQEVHMWAVLRDDRGGMSWKQLSLTAE